MLSDQELAQYVESLVQHTAAQGGTAISADAVVRQLGAHLGVDLSPKAHLIRSVLVALLGPAAAPPPPDPAASRKYPFDPATAGRGGARAEAPAQQLHFSTSAAAAESSAPASSPAVPHFFPQQHQHQMQSFLSAPQQYQHHHQRQQQRAGAPPSPVDVPASYRYGHQPFARDDQAQLQRLVQLQQLATPNAPRPAISRGKMSLPSDGRGVPLLREAVKQGPAPRRSPSPSPSSPPTSGRGSASLGSSSPASRGAGIEQVQGRRSRFACSNQITSINRTLTSDYQKRPIASQKKSTENSILTDGDTPVSDYQKRPIASQKKSSEKNDKVLTDCDTPVSDSEKTPSPETDGGGDDSSVSWTREKSFTPTLTDLENSVHLDCRLDKVLRVAIDYALPEELGH